MTKKRINVSFYEENSWLIMMLPLVRRQQLVHTLLRKRRMTQVSFIEVEKWWLDASYTHEHIIEASSTYLTVVVKKVSTSDE
mmetsp:Transcript_10383/g.13212  ORF Transcript_10383/g.13212 Transcript_10383/m.13212 type:complete len:82 (+) Transcript_10383:38-283(+)